MVLDFKVNRRLVVGMTINFLCPYSYKKMQRDHAAFSIHKIYLKLV